MANFTLNSDNDKHLGTANADIVDGLDGNDTLLGLTGDDLLLGGNGLDSLEGGTGADTQGAGYANSTDYVTHDWLDKIFQQDVNGRVEGENGAPVVYNDGDTDNTYRFATLNGVKLALPTLGNGDDFIGSGETGYQNGTRVSGIASNSTYDDYLAIWDAYNGTGTGKYDDGTPGGWVDDYGYWSATPSASGHAGLGSGYVGNYYHTNGIYVAVEVL